MKLIEKQSGNLLCSECGKKDMNIAILTGENPKFGSHKACFCFECVGKFMDMKTEFVNNKFMEMIKEDDYWFKEVRERNKRFKKLVKETT